MKVQRTNRRQLWETLALFTLMRCRLVTACDGVCAGAVGGAVGGGFAVIVICVCLFVYFRKRCDHRTPPSSQGEVCRRRGDISTEPIESPSQRAVPTGDSSSLSTPLPADSVASTNEGSTAADAGTAGVVRRYRRFLRALRVGVFGWARSLIDSPTSASRDSSSAETRTHDAVVATGENGSADAATESDPIFPSMARLSFSRPRGGERSCSNRTTQPRTDPLPDDEQRTSDESTVAAVFFIDPEAVQWCGSDEVQLDENIDDAQRRDGSPAPEVPEGSKSAAMLNRSSSNSEPPIIRKTSMGRTEAQVARAPTSH